MTYRRYTRNALAAGTAISLSLTLGYGVALADGAPLPIAGPASAGTVVVAQNTAPGAPGSAEANAPKGTAMEQIRVLGQRTPAKLARQAQKEAPNLILVQPYQEIRKLPDVSAAEALRRIPGISLETDEGEGRYVNIRGFDADLNSTTFGGLRLPPTNNASPQGGYRAVTLDSIPVGLIGVLTVTNSNTPDMDAEALGGTIEITPKTAPPGDKPFFIQGDFGTGYQPLRSSGIANLNLTTGGRKGPFSILLTGSYYEDSRGIDDVEPSYFNDAAHPYTAISNLQQRDYELNRWRHAYGITLGYDPDPYNNFYLRAFDAGYTERYDRQLFAITPDGNTTQATNGIISDTLNTSGALQKQLRDETETSIDRIVTAGGRNELTDVDTIDYHVGYTIGTYHKPYDFNSSFTFNQPASIQYSNTGRGNTPLYTINGDYLNPHNYVLSSFSNSTADNYDRELSGGFNYKRKLDLLSGDDEYVQVGVLARLRHKLITAQPYSYPNIPPIPLSVVASSNNETYYAGQYQNGVDIQQTYLQRNLGFGTITSTEVMQAQQQFINARENVFAGFGQYHATWGRLGLLAGVRVEQTRDKLGAYQFITQPDKSIVSGLNEVSHVYTNAFPSIQLRYEIQPDLIARAAWSSTIARPGFNQNTAALTVDLGSGIVSAGNPNLQPATANGFDLSIEKYLANAGIVSLSFFDKEIRNYIVNRTLVGVPLTGFGFPGGGNFGQITNYFNTGSSYARGLEFNYDQRLRFLPGWLSGLGLAANYTFVDSQFEIRPGEYAPLPSTSQHTWNLALYYENDGITARLAAYSTSADLFTVGGSKSSDIYNGARTSLDFGSAYAFAPHWVAYFNAKNLLNTPHTFYEGTTDRPYQREFYLQTYQLGVRFDY